MKILNDMKLLSQWVVWKMEERNGKKTKTPYQISGANAKTNDPSTLKWR